MPNFSLLAKTVQELYRIIWFFFTDFLHPTQNLISTLFWNQSQQTFNELHFWIIVNNWNLLSERTNQFKHMASGANETNFQSYVVFYFHILFYKIYIWSMAMACLVLFVIQNIHQYFKNKIKIKSWHTKLLLWIFTNFNFKWKGCKIWRWIYDLQFFFFFIMILIQEEAAPKMCCCPRWTLVSWK